MKPLVYLAGPIAGLTADEARDWRDEASAQLANCGVESLSPMRGKYLPDGEPPFISLNCRDYEHAGIFFTPKAIMTRDFNDVKRCDALLVNLSGLRRPTLGTVMELAWAHAFQKPAVVVMELEGNPHDNHPMLLETFHFRTNMLEEGIDAVLTILNR